MKRVYYTKYRSKSILRAQVSQKRSNLQYWLICKGQEKHDFCFLKLFLKGKLVRKLLTREITLGSCGNRNWLIFWQCKKEE